MTTWTFQPFPVGASGTVLQPGLHTNTQSFFSPTIAQSGCQYPVVLSSATTVSNTNASSRSVTLPSASAGDRVILLWGDNGNANHTITGSTWTEVVENSSLFVAYRDFDGTEGSSITVGQTDPSEVVYTFIVIRAGSFDDTVAPEASTTLDAGTANSPSLTPSWGADPSLWISAIATDSSSSPATLTSPPSGYTLASGGNETGGTAIPDAMLFFGMAQKDTATDDPGAFTVTAQTSWDVATIAVKGFCTSGTTLTPALHTNTQSFFGPTIRRTMQPSAHTNSQSFYTQTLRRTLKPSLHSDGETFFTPAVRRTLRPAVHTNAQTFFTHTLRRTLRPSLYSDPDTFFTQTLRVTLKPSLLSDGDTFFAPAVRRVLRPSLFTNSQAFFTHTLRSVLKPSLHSDGETFFTQTIRSTLKPALHTNSQAYFTHSLRVTLKPTLHSDGDTFYTHTVTVAGTGISPALFTNSQSFFTHSLRATVKPTLHTNSQAFFTQSLRLTVRPEHNQNLQSFFNPRLSLRLSPEVYVNSSAFFTHAILLAGFVAPSLWVNSQVFYGPTVTSAALGGYPYDDTKKKKKLIFPYVEEAPKTKRQARKAKKRLNEAVVEKISTRLPSPPLPQLVLPDNVRSVTAEYLDAWFEGQLKAEIAAERSLLAMAEESHRDFLHRESVATSALEELFPEGEKLNEARLKEEEFLIQLAWSTYFDS